MKLKHFLSYSAVDGKEFALKLADKLQAGPPPIPVWVDSRELQPGHDWGEQLVEAIRACQSFIFVMTPDSTHPQSVCKREWKRALNYKKHIIPVLLDRRAEMPFLLEPREYVDFSGDFEAALARLRDHLGWLETPAGMKQTLAYLLAAAERDLARADGPDERGRIEEEARRLGEEIKRLELEISNPREVAERNEKRIQEGIVRDQQPSRPAAAGRRARFVNTPPGFAPRYFQNRHVETKMLGELLADESVRMVSVLGRGGTGKTAMVCRLLKALEAGRLPDDGGEMDVDGIIYLSTVGSHRITTPDIYEDLCRLLPEDAAGQLEVLNKTPGVSTAEKTRALLSHFSSGRTVLMLDNFEDVLDQTTLEVRDGELKEALCALLGAPQHGVKVVLTTRLTPRDLAMAKPGRFRLIDLDGGLDTPYAENILREMDADGKLGLRDAPDALLARARERTIGNPRALEALFMILSVSRDTTLAEVLDDTARLLPDDVAHVLVGDAFSRLDPAAQRIMQALAVYGRPVTPAAVDYMLQPFVLGIDSAPVLGRLVSMQFVRREGGRYYLHPIDREYALGRLEEGGTWSWLEHGEPKLTRQALRHRGAEYFRQSRLPRAEWKSIGDLAPQLAEFDLRCEGGEYNTAVSVLEEIGFNYLRLWGHSRLVLEMHERLKGRDLYTDLKAWCSSDIGCALISMGQEQQAIAHFEEAMESYVDTGDRLGECSCLNNLAMCHNGIGQRREAIGYYERALKIAREMYDADYEASILGNLGTVYKNVGETDRAIQHLEMALEIAGRIGDTQSEEGTSHNLGMCYQRQGRLDRAVGQYERALELNKQTGYRDWEANHLLCMASCHHESGKTERAIELYERALVIKQEIGNKRGEGAALSSLGTCHRALGHMAKAIEYYENGLAIAKELSDLAGEAGRINSLGECYAAVGETRRAVTHHERALELARDLDDPDRVSILGDLGNRFAELGEVGRAEELYGQVRDIASRIDARMTLSWALGCLAEARIDAGDYEGATSLLTEGVRLGEEAGVPMSYRRGNLALARLYAGDLEAAHTSAAVAVKDDVPRNNAYAHALLGVIELRRGRLREAREAFEVAVGHADTLIGRCARLYYVLDAKGVAMCGLAVCGLPGAANDAASAFHAARAVNSAAGVVARVVRLLDALRPVEAAGVLDGARRAASGEQA